MWKRLVICQYHLKLFFHVHSQSLPVRTSLQIQWLHCIIWSRFMKHCLKLEQGQSKAGHSLVQVSAATTGCWYICSCFSSPTCEHHLDRDVTNTTMTMRNQVCLFLIETSCSVGYLQPKGWTMQQALQVWLLGQWAHWHQESLGKHTAPVPLLSLVAHHIDGA